MGSYGDAPQLTTYAKAAAAGEAREFNACIQAFEMLENFKDSPLMVDYYTARAYEASGRSAQTPHQQAAMQSWENLMEASRLYGQQQLFRDSLQRQRDCYQAVYDMAEGLAAADMFSDAKDAHASLSITGYKDSTLLRDYYAARVYEAQAPQNPAYGGEWNATDFEKYQQAAWLYDNALLLKDSQARAEACRKTIYDFAKECAVHKDYANAAAIVAYTPGYLDARQLATYYNACHEELLGHYGVAAKLFDTLGDYAPTASTRAENARMTAYTKAMAMLDEGEYADGYALLRTLDDYNGATAYVPQHEMQRAEAHLAAGEYTAAIELFEQIKLTAEAGIRPEYTAELGEAAGLRTKSTLYTYGEMLFANADTFVNYSVAKAAFQAAGDYAPAGGLPGSQRYLALWYQKGEELMAQEEPDYSGARIAFNTAENYTPDGGVSAAIRAKEVMYLKGEMYLAQSNPEYDAARAAFVAAGDYTPEGGINAATRAKEAMYLKGEAYLAQNEPNYDGAKAAFVSAEDYTPEGGVDAPTRVKECWYLIGERLLAQEDPDYDKAIEAFETAGNYAPEGGESAASMVKKCKWLKRSPQLCQTAIAAGFHHTVGLKTDGTVEMTGSNSSGQVNFNGNWHNLVAVTAGKNYTIGLKADGTLLAIGDNAYDQCSVFQWKDITAVSAGALHTVGLKADGTVVAAGNNALGQCNVSQWTDIVAVSAGGLHTVGQKLDGTVVASGSDEYGQCNKAEQWTDIVAVAAGEFHTVGLKSDGTVVAVGKNIHGQCDVNNWTDIIAIAAGANHTVGLKSDGTVVAAGNNSYGQVKLVDQWTDIVVIAAGYHHTAGLKADGTVVAVGSNSFSQCDVSSWTDIGFNAANLE